MTAPTITNSTTEIGDPQTLMALVHDAKAQRIPIMDYGVAHRDLGHAPPTEHVSLVQHGEVLEHYARDMTVRVAAGMGMGELQAALRPHRQFVPVDADHDLTVGEVIQHHVYGPLRASYGSIRDLLLGLRYIDGEGRDVHVGGRTVKNVAGYDMTRFLVGGLGELGLVYESTVRTYAVPQAVAVVELVTPTADTLDLLLPKWLLTDAAPGQICTRWRDEKWLIEVAYFGTEDAGKIQVDRLKMLAEEAGMTIAGDELIDLEVLTDRGDQQRRWRRTARAVVKLVVPPADVGRWCQRLLEQKGASDRQMHIDALPLHGCLFVGGDLDATDAVLLDGAINHGLQGAEGFRVWQRRPENAIAPFAPDPPDAFMLRRLKRTMDPHGLFNPGRFLPVEGVL